MTENSEINLLPPVRPPRHKKKRKSETRCENDIKKCISNNNNNENSTSADKILLNFNPIIERVDEDLKSSLSSSLSSHVKINHIKENNNGDDENNQQLLCPLVNAENDDDHIFSVENVIKNNNQKNTLQKEDRCCTNESVILNIERGDNKQKCDGNYVVKSNKWLFNVPWIMSFISFIQLIIYYSTQSDSKLFLAILFSPFKKDEIWRYLTYAFLHLDQFHLYSNVLLQLLIAIPLETEQGHFRVIFIYFGGIIAGALASSIFQPTLLMVGASAGVYSLLMSHISHITINYTKLRFPIFRIFSLIILLLGEILSLMHRYYLTDETKKNTEIGITAHWSGALSGLLLGFIFYGSGSKSQILRWLKYLCVLFYLLPFLIIIFLYYLSLFMIYIVK